MLKGTFSYSGSVFTVRGYDFGDSMDFLVSPVLNKDKKRIDMGIVYPDGEICPPSWDEFWIGVGVGHVKCTCERDTAEVDGKTVKLKNAVNQEFVKTFGSIIRGMKAGCSPLNRVGNDDLFSTNFNPQSLLTYSYDWGEISTKLQIVKSLTYEDKGVSLKLEDDEDFSTVVYAPKNPHKFALDISKFVQEHDDLSSDWDFSEGDRLYTLEEIEAMNPEKDYSWLRARKYYVVHDIETLEKVCKYLWQFDMLAFDTETTGFKINVTSRRGEGDQLVGCIFSGEPGLAYYIPFKHKKFQNVCKIDEIEYIMEKYLKPLLERKDIICHNGSFDWKVAYIYNICMNLVHDTYILFKVTMGNENPQMKLGLKPLTEQFLNRYSFELDDFVQGRFGKNSIKFWDFDEESTKLYACPDCDNLIELYQWCVDHHLLENYRAKKVYQIEVLFSVVIAYQEFYGHQVKIEEIDALVKELVEIKSTAYAAMVEIAGHDFNPASPKDLPRVMYEELGMPILGKTDTGAPSTDKEVRKLLLQEENPDGSLKYPFVKHLSDYKDASYLESNFTKNIDKLASIDGLMFSSVTQFLETGRVSTSGPNYQGYNDTVKKYIVPRSGYYAIDADYSTIEARIMCSMAGCTRMVEKLKNPDTDYHRQKASDMFRVAYELVSNALRKQSKGVNFGILYGLGDQNLGVNLFGVKTRENTRKAGKLKKQYFIGMEELEPFIEKSRSQGTTQGFSTTYFNRRRYYNKGKTRIDTIERQSCNARIQGTAADLYKLGMVRLFHQIKKRGWIGKFLISAFVHDECFCEIHKSINPFLAMKVVRDAMMIDIEGWTTLFTGMGVGSTWYEAKKTEIPVQVQESLVGTFADNCPEWWNGDTPALSRFIVDSIMNYKKDRVINYLKNQENWGKVLKPTENELCHELMDDIAGGQQVEGLVDNTIKGSKDTIENLKNFCIAFGVQDLFEQANIQQAETSSNASISVDDDEEDYEGGQHSEVDVMDLIKERVETFGVAYTGDGSSKTLYIKYLENNNNLMSVVQKTLTSIPGDIAVHAFKGGEEYEVTGVKVSLKAYSELSRLYMSYKNLNAGGFN